MQDEICLHKSQKTLNPWLPVITGAFLDDIKTKVAAHFFPTVILLRVFYCSVFSFCFFVLFPASACCLHKDHILIIYHFSYLSFYSFLLTFCAALSVKSMAGWKLSSQYQ